MQLIFKRYEKKYMITNKQAANITAALQKHMIPDEYGTYWVQNLYFDTEDWDVIRKSMDKPLYKEKLRLRCYGIPDDNSNTFLELKKKYLGVVYKRRIAIPMPALAQPIRDAVVSNNAQIARELSFYLESNPVSEKMFIAFRRVAYSGVGEDWLRVTFDTDIRYRRENLDFSNPTIGQPVLPPGCQLMEIKTKTSIPLWLSRAMSESAVYGTSYSKYGTCFTDYCIQQEKGDVKYA